MFPSFVDIKIKLQIKFERELRNQISEHQIPKIQEQIIHEGYNLVTTSIDGFQDQGALQKIEARFEVSNEDMIEKGPQAIFDKIPSLVEEMVAQRSKVIFKKMDQITERTGNVVDGKGQALTPELIFQTLEKIEISFDDIGNPIMPTLYIPPDIYKKMQDNPDLWKETPETLAKFEKLIEKKRGEYANRENRRKLVD